MHQLAEGGLCSSPCRQYVVQRQAFLSCQSKGTSDSGWISRILDRTTSSVLDSLVVCTARNARVIYDSPFIIFLHIPASCTPLQIFGCSISPSLPEPLHSWVTYFDCIAGNGHTKQCKDWCLLVITSTEIWPLEVCITESVIVPKR